MVAVISNTSVSLSESQNQQIVDLYLKRFDIVNRETPCMQSFSREQLLDALVDESIVKLLSFDELGFVCGFGMMTLDISKVPWLSIPYFQFQFVEEYQKGLIGYMLTIVVAPQASRQIVSEVIREAIKQVPVGGICCFDYCENVNGLLPLLINRTCKDLVAKEGINIVSKQAYAIFRRN